MDRLRIERAAEDWVAAWNTRDLDRVMAHYSEDVRLCSPLVVKRLGRADGWITGKAELRAYFATGMGNPDLRFELKDVHVGVACAAIVYGRENSIDVVDCVEFDANGLINRVLACYTKGETRV